MSDDLSITMEPDWDWRGYAGQPEVVPNRDGWPWSMIEDGDDPLDFSRRSGAFDWHTDGLYHEPAPKWVTQYCLHPGEKGINTALADSLVVLPKLSGKAKAVLELLCIKYKGHGMKTRQPVINQDGGIFLGVGFKQGNNYTSIVADVDNHLQVGPGHNIVSSANIYAVPGLYISTRAIADTMSELYRALDNNKIIVDWEKGKLLKFNQYRYLHKRERAAEHDTRKFVRIWSTA